MRLKDLRAALRWRAAARRRWGVETSAGRCHIVCVERHDERRPRAVEALSAGATAEQAQRFVDVDTTLLLQPDAYALQWIDAPAVPDAELGDALRWALRERIDWDPADVVVSGYRLPASAGAREVALAAAAPREIIRRLVEAWPHAARKRLAIDVPEHALRNLLWLASGSACAGLLHIGLDASHLIIARAGAVESRRRFALDHTNVFGADGSVSDSFLLDLQRTFDSHQRLAGGVELQRLWVGGIGDIESIARNIGEGLQLRCEPLVLSDLVDWQASEPLHDVAAGIDFTFALGAALR